MSRIMNFIRNINYLTKHSLWDQREEDIVYLTNKILHDGMYEYGIQVEGVPKLNILTLRQSMELFLNNPKSFVRTSDGEVKIMMGMDQPFQKYEKEIADRLIILLSDPNENVYVALNRNYFVPLISKENWPYYRRNAYTFRNFYLEHCNPNIEFLDRDITAFPFGYKDIRKDETEWLFHTWRKLFSERDMVIVCGAGILESYEYDIFDVAESKKIIGAPRKNAWDKHKQLITQIEKEVSKDQTIAFILGMAGKAMIPELTDKGYTCWDIGHLAKYYDVYKRGIPGTKENIAKFYAPD